MNDSTCNGYFQTAVDFLGRALQETFLAKIVQAKPDFWEEVVGYGRNIT